MSRVGFESFPVLGASWLRNQDLGSPTCFHTLSLKGARCGRGTLLAKSSAGRQAPEFGGPRM